MHFFSERCTYVRRLRCEIIILGVIRAQQKKKKTHYIRDKNIVKLDKLKTGDISFVTLRDTHQLPVLFAV